MKPAGHVFGLQNCARCGGDHDALDLFEFERPIVHDDGATWRYWATCPATGDPIIVHRLPVVLP